MTKCSMLQHKNKKNNIISQHRIYNSSHFFLDCITCNIYLWPLLFHVNMKEQKKVSPFLSFPIISFTKARPPLFFFFFFAYELQVLYFTYFEQAFQEIICPMHFPTSQAQ